MALFFTKKTIRTKKTIGQILKSSRKKRNISLERAEQETKIRLKYISALEENNFSEFPAEVYAFGFLERYSNYLGLNTAELLANYKSEMKIHKLIKKAAPSSSPFTLENWQKFKEKKSITLSGQTILAITVAIIIVSLLGYVWFQVKSFAAAPELEIKNPENEIVVSMDKIIIEGKTDSSASLSINNQPISIDPEGYFKPK
ncbi:MAG: helix-turn-helix domain-containing protein [Patescibacteria group bacterium]|nr:helix-turn-helix domain-containing protein [Patescibacteria group bacterium]